MNIPSRIPDEIRGSLPEILASWRESRSEVLDEAAYASLLGSIERLTVVFTEFLRSTDTVETFTRGGEIRALVGEIAGYQHELGRESVGVMDDFAALRRSVWRAVEKSVDLSSFDGAEVARFFTKLMQAADWVTEAGLEAFDTIARADMEEALGRASATDLLTGLPDRDLFSRLLLPRAVASHETFSIVIFDVANFSETVASGEVVRAREALRGLADAVRASVPEDSVCARFGDDEVCAILPDEGSEAAYEVAERVLDLIAREHAESHFEVDVGVAEYPAHGRDAGGLLTETLKALKMAKRVGGSGIVVAR